MSDSQVLPTILPDDELFTADELGRQHKMTGAYFRAEARKGTLACIRLGRAIRFRREDVQRFIESHTVAASIGKAGSAH